MRSADPIEFEQDHRHFLYREYLRILIRFQPPVFVMENVKGILSSTVKNKHIFRKIKEDLENAGYTIHSFTHIHTDSEPEPEDFIIQAEEFDIPQTPSAGWHYGKYRERTIWRDIFRIDNGQLY